MTVAVTTTESVLQAVAVSVHESESPELEVELDNAEFPYEEDVEAEGVDSSPVVV